MLVDAAVESTFHFGYSANDIPHRPHRIIIHSMDKVCSLLA